MKPEDFKFDLLEHAYALRRSALSYTTSHELDPRTTIWLITYDAWREFLRAEDILNGAIVDDRKILRRTLLGIPVRITVEDSEGTPPIQLVMEPIFRQKRTV